MYTGIYIQVTSLCFPGSPVCECINHTINYAFLILPHANGEGMKPRLLYVGDHIEQKGDIIYFNHNNNYVL